MSNSRRTTILCSKGDTPITASNETIVVLIRFRIRGNLRFLSHAETARLFQRACARAGISVSHSRGFNPRPRISLPLPRSVGVETEDDLLCIRLEVQQHPPDTRLLGTTLAARLPDGCDILDVRFAGPKTSVQPSQAAYVFELRPRCVDPSFSERLDRLLAAENLNIRRRTDAKSKIREIDVRPFLKSIELDNNNIRVECKISPTGSIRIAEILELLQIKPENLATPVRRMEVKWQIN
ncbi:MAG: TIGR03936 family radical SAM-associated protein [Planctomycetota bacterium]